MDTLPTPIDQSIEADALSAQAMSRERPRLRNWLRRNLVDRADVEDLLQDLFIELVMANRAARKIEDVGAWLFRAARNRIVDAFRKQGSRPRDAAPAAALEDDWPSLLSMLPDPGAGPDAAYARIVIENQLVHALGDLPIEQREVFLAHEIDGESFAEISARTGVGINTLLGRKQYAVRKLRKTLEMTYRDYSTD
jgi:RNA polymerase sigma factor (sigma-70 family)